MKIMILVAVFVVTLATVAIVCWNSEIGRIHRFWWWFSDSRSTFEKEPSQFGQNDVTTLRNHLHAVSSELTFQIGKARSGEGYELEISADGYVPAFPLVKKMVASAPVLPQWNIVAFKQPNSTTIKMGDIIINQDDVLYVSVKNTSTQKHDLMLYHTDYEYENQEWQQALFVTLDNVLGEYDFATNVGTVAFMNTADADTAIRDDLRPISELTKEFEKESRH